MNDLIKNLTPEQALDVVLRLCEKKGAVRDAVIAEATNLLCEIDVDDIAEDVLSALDCIDVEDCWDRAGITRDGYTSSDEAAVELIDAELEPFFEQTRRYGELEMTMEEVMHCKGVIVGIYRYQHESKSEFLNWAVDIPLDSAGALLDDWRKRCKDSKSIAAMDEFIKDHCPHWAKYLVRGGLRS